MTADAAPRPSRPLRYLFCTFCGTRSAVMTGATADNKFVIVRCAVCEGRVQIPATVQQIELARESLARSGRFVTPAEVFGAVR